jgi:hypothetical protein
MLYLCITINAKGNNTPPTMTATTTATTPSAAATAKRSMLSKVMKAAWTIFRKGGVNFSKALKKAWAWAKKKGMTNAPAAFQVKPILQGGLIKETAKAMCLRVGTISRCGHESATNVWIPTSQIVKHETFKVTCAGIWTVEEVTLPEWLFNQILKEVEDKSNGQYSINL